MLVAAGALCVALLGASPAHAAFTTGACQGDAVDARGASFAASAQQQVFIPFWDSTYCPNLGATAPTVSYTATGSGSGRRVMGARSSGSPEGDNTDGSRSRNQGIRFSGSDEPLSPTDQANINKGTDAVGDEGVIRTIPIALGSVAVAVNVPDTCTITQLPDRKDLSLTGTTTSGSAAITLADTTGLSVGDPVKSANLPADTKILTVDNATQITVTKNATATGSVSVSFVKGTFQGFSAGQKAQLSDFPADPSLTSQIDTARDRVRLQLTRDQVEQIFNGGTEYDTWGELVPFINDGDGDASATDPGDVRCKGFPLVRIRRLDDGGTTYALKDYLGKLNPARGWLTTFNTPDTRAWPNSTRTVAFDYNNNGAVQGDGSTLPSASDAVTKCAAQYAPFSATTCNEDAVPLLQTTEVAAPGGNGNGPLVDKVNDLDGSIGYGDLSTVRQRKTNAFERQTGADDKYWVKLQNRAQTGYADPQSAPLGFLANGGRGSSCSSAVLSGLPTGDDPTTGNWAQVTAADSTNTGYGACTLTYALAWDDYSGPYSALPDQAAEERKARTVKDYLTSAVSAEGQGGLSGFDYAVLPTGAPSGQKSVAQIAREGVAAIGWQKTAGTGGGGGGGTTTPPPAAPSGGGGTTPPPAAPSNAFTFSKPRSVAGSVALALQLPGAGNVRVVASARIAGKPVQIASAGVSRTSGGTARVTLKPNAAARKALRKAKRLKITLAITFTPTGGVAKTQNASVTLTAAKAKK